MASRSRPIRSRASSSAAPARTRETAARTSWLAFATRELLDVAIDQAAVPLVVERLPDHLAGEAESQRRGLGSNLRDRAVALGADLLLRARDHPVRVRLRPRDEVLARLLGVLLRLLHDPVRLLPSRGELLAVLLQQPVRLLAIQLRLFEVPLDLSGARRERGVDPREDVLREDGEDDEERDRAVDQLVGRGQERVLVLGGEERDQWVHGRALLRDEREDEPEQRQGLHEPDADEHVRADEVGGLGL